MDGSLMGLLGNAAPTTPGPSWAVMFCWSWGGSGSTTPWARAGPAAS